MTTGTFTVWSAARRDTIAGDSSRLSRITRPMITSRAEARNGIRQAHARSASSESRPTARKERVARMRPVGEPCWAKAAKRNPRSFLACSVVISTEPPHSPPSAMPCTVRNTVSRIGAATPICPYVGRHPMPTVLTPISSSVATSAFLRPRRSPRWPKRMAPSGRARKPTQKVTKESSTPTAGGTSAKNSGANTRAEAVP